MPAPAELEISCGSCGATLLVEEHMRTAQCPYCASTSIVEKPASPDRPHPEFVLGFVVNRERAARVVRRWLSSRGLFARGDFKKSTPELTRGVYLPAYLLRSLVTRRRSLPAYVMVYRYQEKLFRAIVSGQDAGRVHGSAPISVAKVLLAVAAGLALLAFLFAVFASAM